MLSSGDVDLFLLDTNIAAFVVTGRSASVREHYQKHRQQDRIVVSSIVEGEIRYGLAKAPANSQAHTYMSSFLDKTEVLPWNSDAAKAYAHLRASTEAQGLSFGAFDLQIAAHALALGATLVTHDRVLHRASQYLSITDWAVDV